MMFYLLSIHRGVHRTLELFRKNARGVERLNGVGELAGSTEKPNNLNPHRHEILTIQASLSTDAHLSIRRFFDRLCF